MRSFHIHRSNRVERLVASLATQLRSPRGTPFSPEPVVVQGRGMSVWLAHELSKRLGIWASEMPYPRHFIQSVAKAALGEHALGDPPISEDLIEWTVQANLDDLLTAPEFAPLKRYVEEDDRGLRRAQLAGRIATVFDQYLAYRPEWIRAWEAGQQTAIPDDHAWQPVLWRRVIERLDRPHIARVEATLLDKLRQPTLPADLQSRLPQRVSLFGLSTLPPLYVRVLAALSRHLDVHLFLFSPSPHPWQRELSDDQGRLRVAVDHPLLASLGFLGADFDAVLREALGRERIEPEHHDAHEPPAADTLLGRLQADLYHPVAPDRAEPAPLPEGDATLTVHACHGPMREVEVLRDQILALVAREEDPVRPEDIVVLCPDIEAYAPLVDAVFARQTHSDQFLPYHVSDRTSRRESPVIDAFQRMLSMVGGRATATEVADLLVLDSVQERFGLDASDVERIEEWIAASGLRWGVDGKHRGRMGVPGCDDYTWKFGFERLMLGYAMPAEDKQLFGGVLPYDEIEGQAAAPLGRLVRFARTLFGWLEELEKPRTLPEWAAALGRLGADLFADDAATARQLGRIRRALETVTEAAAAAGFEGTVDVAVVRHLLAQKVDALSPERGFLSGGITFCAMIPMRSIPFRVVCLLGMNDGDFPRSPRPVQFDLIRNGPARMPGDRSPRDDDRYLFLETLGAARERVVVTYSGQGVRDNRPRPPSVCLGELFDAVAARYESAGVGSADEAAHRKAVVETLTVRHRLQGFHPVYFDGTDARLFSYARDYVAAAESVRQTRQERRAFADGPIETALAADIRLDELVRFFRAPATFFLNRRLGVYLKDYDVALSDREPLELDGLEQWQLGEPRVDHLLDGLSLDESEALLRGRGQLPLGSWGRLVLEEVDATCSEIAGAARALRAGGPEPPLGVEVGGDGWTVKGAVDQRFAGGVVEHTYSSMKPKLFLSTWIRHVAACASGFDGPSAVVARRDRKAITCRYNALASDSARKILGALVQLFREGQSRPLPFSPAASWSYFKKIASVSPDDANYDRALFEAEKSYAEGNHCEVAYDPHLDRAFAGRLPPFDADYDHGTRPAPETRFHAVAEIVYRPLDAALDRGGAA